MDSGGRQPILYRKTVEYTEPLNLGQLRVILSLLQRPATDVSSFDAYVVMCPFRQLCPEFKIIIQPLAAHEADQLEGADGYYCDEIDSAILVLRFRRDFVNLHGQVRVLELLATWGCPVVAPELMQEHERERFFYDHLARYQTYVQQYPSTEEDSPMLLRVLDNLSEHVNAPEPEPASAPIVDPWMPAPSRHRRAPSEWSF